MKMSSNLDFCDFRLACRTCLRTSVELHPLNECSDSVGTWQTTGELLVQFADVKIRPDDELPQNICENCLSDFNAALNYKQKCEESDRALRSNLMKHMSRVTVRLRRIDEPKEQSTVTVDTEVAVEAESESEVADSTTFEETETNDEDDTLNASGSHAGTIYFDEDFIDNNDDSDYGISDPWDELLEDDLKIEEAGALEPSDDGVIMKKKRTKFNPNKEKYLLCEFCALTFYAIGHLKQHHVVHSGRKDYICDICQRKYTTKAILKAHMRSHQTKSQHKRHLCSHCGKGFIYRSLLQEHMNIHTGIRPYQCDKCSANFASRQNLRMHKRSHEPVKRHICTECGRGFQKNNKLRIHMRIHTGEKPYKCNVCAKAFNQTSSLKSHMRDHTGERKFECTICSERFTQIHQLKSHRHKMGHWMPGTEPPPKPPKPVNEQRKRSTKKVKEIDVTEIETTCFTEYLQISNPVLNGHYNIVKIDYINCQNTV